MLKNTGLGWCVASLVGACGQAPETRAPLPGSTTQVDPNSGVNNTKQDPKLDPKLDASKNNPSDPSAANSKSQNMLNAQVETTLSCSSAVMVSKPAALGSDNFNVESIAGKDTLRATYLKAGGAPSGASSTAPQTIEMERTPESKASADVPLGWRGVFAGATPATAMLLVVTLYRDTKTVQLSNSTFNNVTVECQKFPARPAANALGQPAGASGASITNVIFDNSQHSIQVTNNFIDPNKKNATGTGNATTSVSPNITTSQTVSRPDPSTVTTITTTNGTTTTSTTTSTSSNSVNTSSN